MGSSSIPSPASRVGKVRRMCTISLFPSARRPALGVHRFRLRMTAILALATLAGCLSPADPTPNGNLALLTTAEGGPLTVLDLQSGTTVERPASGVREDVRTLATESRTLYYAGIGRLVDFDLVERRVLWVEPLGGDQQARWAGQAIYANFSLALGGNEKTLLLADSYYQGGVGVAIVDLSSRTAIGFIPRLRARKMFRVPPGALLPEGGVLALGTSEPQPIPTYDDTQRRRGSLYLLSGDPPTIRDSIKFLSSADSSAGGVAEMMLDPAGRYLYFTTFSSYIHKYDLETRTYAGSLKLPVFGPLEISPDGASVYVIDRTQTIDNPGSGFMYVCDSALTAAHEIDLNSASREGLAPQLTALAVSRDGLLVYVGAGTSSRGPLYGVQHGSIIVVDAQEKAVKRVFPLTTWGVRSILPL